MPEAFLATGLDIGAQSPTAPALLEWAADIENAAPPETIYRRKEGRTTLRFEQAGRTYFLKRHTGIGWREVFKNFVSLKLPVISAKNEYRALLQLQRLGLATPQVAAYAVAGWNPAHRQSIIVTAGLVDTVSLEAFCVDWRDTAPPFAHRLRLVRLLAGIARRMHAAGINHRDFYLCHFHLEESSLDTMEPRCYLIDLHRAQVHSRLPDRWREKDLAGLYFSAMDCGLTRRDLLRFMRHYEPGGLRQALGTSSARWRRVARRAQKLYRSEHAADKPFPELHG